MSTTQMKVGGVLLAGGFSRRMGRDKALLAWRGTTLFGHQAESLRAAGATPLLLAARDERLTPPQGFTLVADSEPGSGPARALADAWAATAAGTDVLLALAIDVPCMPADYLRGLAKAAMKAGRSVVPMRAGYFEPLAAAWHRSSEAALRAAANRSLQGVCATLEAAGLLVRREVRPEEAAWFENVNTPEDYARLHGGGVPSPRELS